MFMVLRPVFKSNPFYRHGSDAPAEFFDRWREVGPAKDMEEARKRYFSNPLDAHLNGYTPTLEWRG